MARLVKQDYTVKEVARIEEMHIELWNESEKYRVLCAARDNLKANYDFTKKYAVDAIDENGESTDIKVRVNGPKTRFMIMDWVATIAKVKSYTVKSHLRKSFPKLTTS